MQKQTDYRSPIARIKSERDPLVAALLDAGAGLTDDLGHMRCPFHGDTNGSLSVYEYDGTYRFKCHGCDAGGTILDVIMRSEGLDISSASREAIKRHSLASSTSLHALMSRFSNQKPRSVYATLDELIAMLQRVLHATCTRQDLYTDAADKPVMVVLRFDGQDGVKQYRPAHPNAGGWSIGDPANTRLPLFALKHLLANPAEQVYVVEGEKAACALLQRGLLGTTSAHGAKSPQRTDWSPLAGRAVTIWPDNDRPGAMYGNFVSSLLSALNPAPTISVIEPAKLDVPLPPGGDAYAFFNLLEEQ